MKKIGLIGGLSWASTITYYEIINKLSNRLIGPLHSMPLVIDSLNFKHFSELVESKRDDLLIQYLSSSVETLVRAGAEMIVICCNTAHKVADALQKLTPTPIINVCDVVAHHIQLKNIQNVALLGTKPTMEQTFYREKLESYGIRIEVPSSHDRDLIHKLITEELSANLIREETRTYFRRLCKELIAKKVEAIVLACTELPLVIDASEWDIPVINTVEIHANEAFSRAID